MIHRLQTVLPFLLLAIALVVTSVSPVTAQAVEGSVPGGTTAAAAADAELWRAIRQGGNFTSTSQNGTAGLLIQSQGHTWQQFRDGPLSMVTAIVLGGIAILLCLFYTLRGRIRIDAGPAGVTIKRFNGLERAAHWTLACSFIILGLTGLNLLFGRKVVLPWLGHDAFSAMTLYGKLVHNYVAFAFAASIVIILVLWIAHNIPNRHDIVWMLRGGGLFGGGHPPARKFNAGQKILFWMIILCGGSITLSGWALLNPFTTTMMADTAIKVNMLTGLSLPTEISPLQEQQLQAAWHTIMAVVMMAIVIAHIYIGSVGMEGAIDAMTTGDVDLNWAKEHHSLWVEEVEAEEAAARRQAPHGTPAE